LVLNACLAISFLNTLLPIKHQIQDLQYSKNEYQGANALDRKAIFDLNCVSTTGERFIVELQKAKQNFFKDRSVYYATFPIQEQAVKGDWDFKLAAVYTVGILDFVFDEDTKSHNTEVVHYIQLKNQRNQVFYDKLTFIYITLPQFKKSLNELQSIQDKWFYVFRHLSELHEIPPVLQEAVFLQLFEAAKVAKFSPSERQAYENSLKYYRDLKNVTDTARDEGREEGFEEGFEEGVEKGKEEGKTLGLQTAALAMHQQGLNPAFIAQTLQIDMVTLKKWLGLPTE
jgi:predicted transposase/invertase (TIGR01784 family)